MSKKFEPKSYPIPDWYTPEGKRQIKTVNALLAQMELGFQNTVEQSGIEYGGRYKNYSDSYIGGKQAALMGLIHVSGVILGNLSLEEEILRVEREHGPLGPELEKAKEILGKIN